VAGFIGQTRRGPIGEAIRIEGWRRFVRLFGGLEANRTATYALRGYFENGGQVAYFVRVAGGTPKQAEAAWAGPASATGVPLRYVIRASSPGKWGAGITVVWDWRHGPGWFAVTAPGEDSEYLTNLDAAASEEDESKGRGKTLEHRVFLDSDLIELV